MWKEEGGDAGMEREVETRASPDAFPIKLAQESGEVEG